MSLKIQELSPEETLEGYLDSIYLQSHSEASVKGYKTAINGKKDGFRKFLMLSLVFLL